MTNKKKAKPKQTLPRLSPRELQVLRLIMDGRKYSDIADELELAHETVKTYVKNLQKKLGIKTKVGIAVWGVNNLKNL